MYRTHPGVCLCLFKSVNGKWNLKSQKQLRRREEEAIFTECNNSQQVVKTYIPQVNQHLSEYACKSFQSTLELEYPARGATKMN